MNQLRRNPNSNSRRGNGAHVGVVAASARVPVVPAAVAVGSTAAVAAGSPRGPSVPVVAAAGFTEGVAVESDSVAGAPATQSPVSSLPAWWTSSSPMGSSQGTYPPGGFTNFLQSNSGGENFHLVGNLTNRRSTSPSQSVGLKRTYPVETNAQEKETTNVDEDGTNDDDLRTERRLNWTKEEDIRLASAWLRNSKDPVDGTDRKSDQYWADVTKEYNKTTEVSRRRNRNQLKIRWDRVKKPVMDFHGCWERTTKVYRSGVSDDQLMEIAEKMYAGEHKGKDFLLKHFWKVVRLERKWSAYVKREQEKEKKKGATNPAVDVVNLDDSPNIRPIGHKKAKSELYGKNKKASDAYSVINEKLDKFIEASTVARKDREKVVEVQHEMANSKLEAYLVTGAVHILSHKQLQSNLIDHIWQKFGNSFRQNN